VLPGQIERYSIGTQAPEGAFQIDRVFLPSPFPASSAIISGFY
jgi:hypothetical protein